MEIDAKDRKILYLLLHFSRFSLSTIAKNVQLSRENVDYRIKRMMRLGVIKGFVINTYLPRLFHTHGFDIFLKIEKIGIKEKDEIIRRIADSPYVLKVEECEGRWNLYIGMVSDNMPKIKVLLEQIRSLCDYHLSDIIIFPIALKTYTERVFFMEDTENLPIHGKSPDIRLYKDLVVARNKFINYDIEDTKLCKPADIDNVGIRLIELLKDNARCHLVGIAKTLGISANAVNYRIKQMINEGVIAYFTTNIDFQKLGYIRAYLFLNLKENNPRKEMLLKSLKKDKRTDYFNYYIGRWPYVFSFIIRDNRRFQEILYKLCEEYSDIILDYHILWSTKIHKWTAIPQNISSFSR